MTKIAGFGSGSGSISQRHGSADPDPDPPQNVMDVVLCPEGLAPGGKVPGKAHNLPHARHARDDVVQPASRGTSIITIYAIMIYTAPCGQKDYVRKGGEGLALEISNFVGPCDIAGADRRVVPRRLFFAAQQRIAIT
jgi:hypothetical protein